MPKITFIADHRVKQGDGKGPHYRKGETYDLEFSYAEKYKNRGLAVDFVPNAEQEQLQLGGNAGDDEAAKLAARAAVVIPDDLNALDWHDLRALAVSLTDETVRSKEDAFAAIAAEQERRANR